MSTARSHIRRSTADSPQPILTARQLECGYGTASIVRPIDLDVHTGEILALLGPNGAGKSTLLLTLAGLLPHLGGVLSVDGNDMRRGHPAAVARAGIVLVPDDRALFADLTVEENLEVARRRTSRPARELIELFPALEARWRVKAGSLSGGEQQMLAMARGIVQAPRVLLIDELSMGLAPVIVEALLATIRRIADDTDAAVIVVEQHVNLALEVADRAMVLVHGEVTMSGRAADLARRPNDLETAYLGADHRRDR